MIRNMLNSEHFLSNYLAVSRSRSAYTESPYFKVTLLFLIKISYYLLSKCPIA